MAKKDDSSRTIRVDLIPDFPVRPVAGKEKRALVVKPSRKHRRTAAAPAQRVSVGRYQDLIQNLYDAALYWRFLYEQSGDMGIVRAALEEMACRYHPDIELALGKVMDAALARFDGPIQTFKDSLVAFARANYALRLENGRCATSDIAECGGNHYDPHNMHTDPPLEAELDYSGSTLTY